MALLMIMYWSFIDHLGHLQQPMGFQVVKNPLIYKQA